FKSFPAPAVRSDFNYCHCTCGAVSCIAWLDLIARCDPSLPPKKENPKAVPHTNDAVRNEEDACARLALGQGPRTCVGIAIDGIGKAEAED
ncbi:MAG TPA: hypothetical protein VJ372_12530, partial [Pyrinomonadaceae bacterium]|nr:hypothetical protein [Pyrinomonadaceae bacterium]